MVCYAFSLCCTWEKNHYCNIKIVKIVTLLESYKKFVISKIQYSDMAVMKKEDEGGNSKEWEMKNNVRKIKLWCNLKKKPQSLRSV